MAQFDELKPSVIVVMNESFADLSDFDGMRCGYEGPQFFNSIDDGLYRGELFVNVHGGGTCNTEFEFLTSNSLGYIGAGKYPYSTFQLDPIDNLARQFGSLGYTTTAMHPNYASNWNRNKVYAAFGFDSFMDINAFGGMPLRGLDGRKKMETPTGIPIFHSGVSDQATYQATLDLLAEDEAPQFVFNVTMQNHGSYNQNNIPEDKLTHYYPTGTYEDPSFAETPERLNEYLSCIEESDRALEWFVGELRKLDRPVVLVFFGDHQPSMTPDYNDAWYTNEDDLTHTQRVYHAEYVMWANYDVAGNSQSSEVRDTSVDVLGTIMLHAIGAPLTDYQKAQLATREQIKATNLHGYLGADDTWYTPEQDSPTRDLRQDGPGRVPQLCREALGHGSGDRTQAGRPIRGVNLGNWLVLERWMESASLPGPFAGTRIDDEKGLRKELAEDVLADRLAAHRASYVTRDTFAWLAATGLQPRAHPRALLRLWRRDARELRGPSRPRPRLGGRCRRARARRPPHGTRGAERLRQRRGERAVHLAPLPRSGGFHPRCARANRAPLCRAPRLFGIEPMNEPASPRIFAQSMQRYGADHPNRVERSTPIPHAVLAQFYRLAVRAAAPHHGPEVRSSSTISFSWRRGTASFPQTATPTYGSTRTSTWQPSPRAAHLTSLRAHLAIAHAMGAPASPGPAAPPRARGRMVAHQQHQGARPAEPTSATHVRIYARPSSRPTSAAWAAASGACATDATTPGASRQPSRTAGSTSSYPDLQALPGQF